MFILAGGAVSTMAPLRLAGAALFPFPASVVPVGPPAGNATPPPMPSPVSPPSLIPSPSALASPPAPPPPAAIIRRVDNPQMRIAITFDACATNGQPNGFDRPVLRVLQREQVPATIFTSGRWVEFHPDAMALLTAEPLIEFANHSYDHPHMTRQSVGEIGAEIDRTEAALGRYGRRSVAFRPPFGDFDDRVLRVARDKQIPAVLWDVVSGDPSASATAEGMIRTVVRNTRAGSIVIFHINGRETQTASALPTIFRQLRARGFEFVHISTLLSSGVAAVNPELPVANLRGNAPKSPHESDVDGIMPPEQIDPVDLDARLDPPPPPPPESTPALPAKP
jgi:peptidoglycan/xylan/chitin deacetylase (PgdA/CDA1 family)